MKTKIIPRIYLSLSQNRAIGGLIDSAASCPTTHDNCLERLKGTGFVIASQNNTLTMNCAVNPEVL